MELTLLLDNSQGIDLTPYGSLTPQEAADYLRSSDIFMRSFSETLRVMYPQADISKRLQRFFQKNDSSTHKRSVEKKIVNWLSGRNQPDNREDLFRIAFALDLSETHLDFLLGLITGYLIQYRDGRELVLAWFLRNGYGYQHAIDFFDSLPAYEPAQALAPEKHMHVTRVLKEGLVYLESPDKLRLYYQDHIHLFGSQHLRSYEYFDRYLGHLVHPDQDTHDKEPSYSIEHIFREYLSMHVPSTRSRRHLSQVQRAIKQGWPNPTAIKNTRNHTKDVSRKLLMLLYVVTEDNELITDVSSTPNNTTTLETSIDHHWWTLNAILNDCSMAPLDPRNTFDWLVLYSISGHADASMSSRMEQVIMELF